MTLEQVRMIESLMTTAEGLITSPSVQGTGTSTGTYLATWYPTGATHALIHALINTEDPAEEEVIDALSFLRDLIWIYTSDSQS